MFKAPWMETQFALVHPDLKEVLLLLDKWSKERHYPEPVVTEVWRDRQQMLEIYYSFYKRKGLDAAEAKALADRRFSWHMCRCAFDLRNFIYSPIQLMGVVNFLRAGRESPMWEILSHDVGRGHHLHVGRRDFSWRQKFAPEEAA